jgi:hypothetical protein
VVDLDNRLYRLKQDRKNANVPSAAHNLTGQFKKLDFSAKNVPTPMEIGNIESQEEVMVNGLVLSNSRERLDEIRQMEPAQRRQVCVQESRCHYCKRVVGTPPAHVAATCPLKNKRDGSYCGFQVEVSPVEVNECRNAVVTINVVSEVQDTGSKRSLLVKQGKITVGIVKSMVEVMLDSGAMGMGYIDQEYARNQGLEFSEVEQVIQVKSIDGSDCGSGKIQFCVKGTLCFDDFNGKVELLVIDSPRHPIILGYQWFKTHNPTIDWKSEEIIFNNV